MKHKSPRKAYFRWSSWSDDERFNFVQNILVGVLISLVTLVLPYSHKLGQVQGNQAYDYLVREEFIRTVQDYSANNTPPVSEAIRLVAFDEATYDASLSRGFWTPRALLGQCVLAAVRRGAAAVVVDFVFDRPVPLLRSAPPGADENAEFLVALEEAARLAAGKSLIIFPQGPPAAVPEPFQEAMAQLFARHPEVLQHGMADIFYDPTDNIGRNFGFFSREKRPDGGEEVRVAMPILAALHLWYPQRGHEQLATAVQAMTREKSATMRLRGQDLRGRPSTFVLHDRATTSQRVGTRIRFRLAPREITAAHVPGAVDPLLAQPDLARTPAAFLEAPVTVPDLRGKVVVIGSTDPRMGDVHLTPLGKMPGVFVLVNVLDQVLRGGQVSELPMGWALLLETVIIVISAFLCMHSPSSVAFLITTGLFLLLFTPVSIFFFSKFGLVLNFWFPSIGVWLHRVIIDLEKEMKEWFKNKIRTRTSCRGGRR